MASSDSIAVAATQRHSLFYSVRIPGAFPPTLSNFSHSGPSGALGDLRRQTCWHDPETEEISKSSNRKGMGRASARRRGRRSHCKARGCRRETRTRRTPSRPSRTICCQQQRRSDHTRTSAPFSRARHVGSIFASPRRARIAASASDACTMPLTFISEQKPSAHAEA